ncbi:MAG TPA: methyltransferase domain-containing protein [Candidatus Methylomirabilis sp.]|nr:methyltransferase domain-containing protein [Candidatus Methylomirabilis sp.]
MAEESQAALIREIPARVKRKARPEAAWVALRFLGLALCAVALISSCQRAGKSDDGPRFPTPDRPVAPIISSSYSDEKTRDEQREAEQVMDRLGVGPGTRVADIGAGDGYYSTRLARRLGASATIYAEDVKAEYLERLEDRLRREGIQGVRIILGQQRDPRLPPGSIDVALLAHMYHEIENPYEFLYRLRPALAPHGRVGVVDADRPTRDHGTPPALLQCELAAVGYRQVDFLRLAPTETYLAVFTPPDELPRPESIRPCKQ